MSSSEITINVSKEDLDFLLGSIDLELKSTMTVLTKRELKNNISKDDLDKMKNDFVRLKKLRAQLEACKELHDMDDMEHFPPDAVMGYNMPEEELEVKDATKVEVKKKEPHFRVIPADEYPSSTNVEITSHKLVNSIGITPEEEKTFSGLTEKTYTIGASNK